MNAGGVSDSGSKKDDKVKNKDLVFPILTSPMGELSVVDYDDDDFEEND